MPLVGSEGASPGVTARVLVTLPVYNEEERIVDSVAALKRAFKWPDYTIAVVEDGSTDRTPVLTRELQSRYPDLVVMSSPCRLGRGRALRRLWRGFDARIYCYTDVDLPAGAEAVETIVQRVLDGAGVATGSRYCDGAKVNRPPLIKRASLSYNWIVRQAFGDGIYDHQCGLKAFSREAFAAVDRVVVDDRWFWDTECLIQAVQLGYRVDEVPLDWKERRYGRTNLRRLASELPYFASSFIRLRSKALASASPAPQPVGGAGISRVFQR